jgi:hypothetical protein
VGAILRAARYGASGAARGTDALASQPVRRAHSARSGRRMPASSWRSRDNRRPACGASIAPSTGSRPLPCPGRRPSGSSRPREWRRGASLPPQVWRLCPSPGRMGLLRRLMTAAESADEPPPATHSTRAEWCHVGLPRLHVRPPVARVLALGGARIRRAESQWKRLCSPSHGRCANPHTQRGRGTLLRARARPNMPGTRWPAPCTRYPRWKLPAAAVGN